MTKQSRKNKPIELVENLVVFDRKNPEHRAIMLKTIRDFRDKKLTFPKIAQELRGAGLDTPHRNILNTDDEFAQAFNQRKALLSRVVPKVSKSPKDYEALLEEKKKFEAYYLIALELLHNRGVSNKEAMEQIQAAVEGKPWA
jgi:hypothetical protein